MTGGNRTDWALQALTVIGPIVVTALFAGLGVALREWRQERDQNHRLNAMLEQAEKEVRFLKSWTDAALPLLSLTERDETNTELKDSLARIRRRVDAADRAPVHAATRNWWRTLWLSDLETSSPLRLLKWTYRLGLFLYAIIAYSFFSYERDPELSWATWFFVRVAALVILAIPALIMRAIYRARTDTPHPAPRVGGEDN
ncbi:hypothetical protein [Kineococcus rubinsiae]|uniref:hypothetical protein n=1 Tax=Kineococcus rubinsiae TaxID=2609562 RepID=UPI0014313BA6|nr:hypothetical protein [Kineococcus rubinsiae]NIZ90344.1 hypothetical protein [Kineococcus rubinsiae]